MLLLNLPLTLTLASPTKIIPFDSLSFLNKQLQFLQNTKVLFFVRTSQMPQCQNILTQHAYYMTRPTERSCCLALYASCIRVRVRIFCHCFLLLSQGVYHVVKWVCLAACETVGPSARTLQLFEALLVHIFKRLAAFEYSHYRKKQYMIICTVFEYSVGY